MDDEGVMYRRRPNAKHQLVVPQALVYDVIKANHNPVFIAHPGMKRTFELISLGYWWPGMRKSIEDYIRRCDPCQRRKEDREFVAPLGEVEEPTAPFQVTSMDITGPYLMTPRKNKYLLTFIDHFTKYVEAFPIPDQTAETCARVYATQIIARHGTGSTLITDQGRSFISSFFKDTCKMLGIRRVNTSSYHPSSNGMIERWHRSLHTGLSHYIDSANTNWDVLVPFYLMAYRATPNTTTGYSPFYLLHGREMTLPSSDDLKAKLSKEVGSPDHTHRLENLKSSLKFAYESVKKANRKSHLNNKRLYDRKAKLRSFEIGDLVYLYNPARKPGQCHKFHKPWTGPFKVTAKISDLNYEIVSLNHKKQIVHINRLKEAYNPETWNPKPERKPKRTGKTVTQMNEGEENEITIGSTPLWKASRTEVGNEHRPPPDPVLDTPEPIQQSLDTPNSEYRDPSYEPPETPRSRRELRVTRPEPPVTRSRARVLTQDDGIAEV